MAKPTAKELHELRAQINQSYTAKDKARILERIDKEIEKIIYTEPVNTQLREKARKLGIRTHD